MVSERAERWGFHRMLSGGGGKVGGRLLPAVAHPMVWVYPAGGATVSQEEKGSQAE